jgi:hemerythrin superfamily protein
MDVIQLLKKDHKMVQKMFKEFEALSGSRGAQKKSALVDQIREALTVHAQVEEELVYPAFQESRSMKDLVSEAKEEHQVAKYLLTGLEELQPDDEQYDARVKVLCEYVMHHVKEEEKEIFPQAQKRLSAKRLEALGEQVEERRNELMGEGEDTEEDEDTGMDDEAMNDEAEGEEGTEEMDEQENKPDRPRRRAA